MIGYLYLLGALLAGLSKGFCGKKLSGYTAGFGDAAFVNLLRMVFCVLIGAITLLGQGIIPFAAWDPYTLLCAALSGLTTAGFVVLWLVAVRTGAYMMLEVFLMLGSGITVLFGWLFLGEDLRWNHPVGFGLLLIAAWLMTSYNQSLKGKMTLSAFGILLACGAVYGLSDVSQKLFVHTVPQGNTAEFSFYTYLFGAVVLLILRLVLRAKEKTPGTVPKPLPKSAYLTVGLMALFLFLNTYLKTRAAAYLDSALLYPLNQGAALMLSTLMAAIFFGEKITLKCLFGLLIAFGALMIINLL